MILHLSVKPNEVVTLGLQIYYLLFVLPNISAIFYMPFVRWKISSVEDLTFQSDFDTTLILIFFP